MKNVLAIGLAVFLVVIPASAGNITINPGSEYTLSQDPATGSASSNNGNITFTLLSLADVNTRTLNAQSRATAASIGTGTASSQIFYDFEVGSTPETAGNTVGAWINYLVTWGGSQTILAVGASNASVEIELVLRDVTGVRNLDFKPIHDFDLQTHRVKVVVAGINFNDSGQKVSTFPAVLKRGHTYRLTLRLSATLFLVTVPASGAIAESVYGSELNLLNVKVGLDEDEILQRLDSFENHRHIYLTGRGIGHNNVEAESSPPLFDKPPISRKMFPLMLLEDDMPMMKPEAISTGKPVFDET